MLSEMSAICVRYSVDIDIGAEMFNVKTLMQLFSLLLKHNKNDFANLILIMNEVVPLVVRDIHEVSQTMLSQRA